MKWIARTLSLLTIAAAAAASCAHKGGGSGGATSAPNLAETAATDLASAPSLAGTSWQVVDVAGGGSDSSRATVQFAADGMVSGTTGCNNFTGTAKFEGTSLTLSPLATTRRACEEALMNQERSFLSAMQSVRRFSLEEGGELRLPGEDGGQLLRLSRISH